MKTRRLAALGGLALGLGTLSLSPTLAGAERLAPPSDSSAVSPDSTVSQSQAAFAAFLSGNEEVPPTDSSAWAWAEFRPSADGTSLAYSARVFGLVGPTAGHLHLGAPGVAGPVVAPLQVPDDPGTSGCIDLHGMTTGTSPGCDLAAPPTTMPEPGSTTSTTAGGSESTGGTGTTGSTSPETMAPSATDPTSTTGATTSTIATPPTTTTTSTGATQSSQSDPDCWDILHASGPASSSDSSASDDTSSTGAPARDGQCGFADISGTITAADLTGPLAGMTIQDLLADIRAGDIYINLHTDVFPAGEIRGQLVVWGSGASATTPTSSTMPTSSSSTMPSDATSPGAGTPTSESSTTVNPAA